MSTHEAEDLIASFYDAAPGRASWHAALHAVAARLDCALAQIIGVDLRRGRLIFSFEGARQRRKA